VELAGQAKELVARRRKLTLERNLKGRQEFEKASFPSIESDTLKALEGQQRVVEERLTLIERRLGLLQEQAGVLKTLAKFYAENLDTLERYRRTAEKKVTATSFAEVYSVVNDGVMALPAWLRSIPTETRLWWSSSENRERARQRAAAAGVVLALALLLYVAGLWWLRRWPAAAGSRSLLLELAHGVLLPMVLYGATRGLVAWDPSLPRGAARFAVFFAFLALYRVLRASAEHVANRYPPCDPFRPWAVWALRYWIALWFVADFLSGVGASKALVFLAWALLKLGLFLLALGCLHVNREPLLAISRVAEEGRLARWGRYYNDRVPQLYLGGLVFLLVVGAAGIAGYEELAGTIMRRSFLSLLLAIGSMSLVRLALHGLQRLLSGLPENRRNSLLEPLGTALGVAAGGLAVLLLVDLWVPSVSAWRLLTSEAVTVAGKRVLGCLLLGGLAVLASRLASFSLQVFGHALLARVGSEAAVRRQRTLTPLLESMAKLAIYCVAALLILRELGFDPTPILAGAGVLGLAIGFGAQSLVKDVITGFFILAEDLISVGDVVDLDGKIGLVEAMTVRTTKLRFFSGELRTIPNSEIRQIGNWNRGFMRAVITIGVAYESNIEKAMKVLLELAWDYHRQHLDIMLAAPEVHGILEFGSSDIKIRAVFMVKPMKQWDVEREFKRLLKQAFDEHGIEIPFNRQVVYLRQDTAAERTPEPPEPPAEPQPQS
jgi:small conductance mechanosensitive channel